MRIKNIKVLDEKFYVEDDEAFSHDMNKTFGLVRGDKEYKVNIKFDYPASIWVKEHHWIDTQHIEEINNKAIIFTCDVEGLDTIEKWVLGYGELAEVLEPRELRKRVKKTAEMVEEKY